MLADVVDAVVGIDTHRDTHTAQIVDGLCRPLAELTVANTDIRYRCWQGTVFSCQGIPLGDGAEVQVRVSAS